MNCRTRSFSANDIHEEITPHTCIVFSILSFGQMEKIINSRPNPPKLVNDYSGTLTTEQIATLEHKLVKYDDSTSNQFAVVLVKSTDGYSIEDAAIELGRKWGWGIRISIMVLLS